VNVSSKDYHVGRSRSCIVRVEPGVLKVQVGQDVNLHWVFPRGNSGLALALADGFGHFNHQPHVLVGADAAFNKACIQLFDFRRQDGS